MASLAEKDKRRTKDSSILGLALARSLNCASAAGSQPTEAEPQSARLPGTSDVSRKITSKYASLVKECEQKNRERLTPLVRQHVVPPNERDLTSSMKGELNAVLKKVGMDPGDPHRPHGWDSLAKNHDFQKNMQFLVEKSRTGQYSEQYGEEGNYNGDFWYSMRFGTGKHEFRNEVYDGEFKWDTRNGSGTLTKEDGSKIKGCWQAGKPHGRVTLHDPAGKMSYEGEFKDGKRHGVGTQHYESGDVYDGSWHEGRLHGRGVYYFANGDRVDGIWSHGQYDGVCTYHRADGSRARHVYRVGKDQISRLVSTQEYGVVDRRWGSITARPMVTAIALDVAPSN